MDNLKQQVLKKIEGKTVDEINDYIKRTLSSNSKHRDKILGILFEKKAELLKLS